MGEIADGLLNGDFDSITGEYLGEGNGYPRTHFNSSKQPKNASIEASNEIISAYFGEDNVQVLDNGGVNIKIPGNGIFTIWWRKGKWVHSKKPHQWFYFKNSAKEHATEAISRISGIIEGGKKVAAIKANEEIEDMLSLVQEHNKVQNEIAKEQLDAYCDFKSKQGVQSCLDHIQKKIDYGQANNLSPSNVAMLNNLLQELRQYL